MIAPPQTARILSNYRKGSLMARYVPIIVGVVLIVGLTVVQARMTDRLSGTNITAEQKAELLKNVPMNIGSWHGEDKPVDERIKDTAGAVGAVSRTYHNVRTGEVVDLWLIVGHGRDISAHTPDICYHASGFTARAKENSLYPFVLKEGEPEVPFLTNTFFREDVTGRRLVRVFWTWYNTEDKDNKGKVVWEAPTNARWHFGNTRALYKMYFTSEMRDPLETAEQSPCLRFAREFLPEVEKALGEVYNVEPSTTASASSSTTDPQADAAKADTGAATPGDAEAETESAPLDLDAPTGGAAAADSLLTEPTTTEAAPAEEPTE
jgi:hypothetical protein